MPPPPDALPIEPVVPAILDTLAKGAGLVLQAPPGAGKTTRVPLALLDAPFAAKGKIILIEPRRIAARAAARRMAASLGEPVGQTIGWRMRLDTKVSAATRIEVMTDGLFTRRLQSDPELTGVAAVLFDEFHERRLEADLGLALAVEARSAFAPHLRLLVMSATLDGERVGRLIDAPVLTSAGRAHPVETRHVPPERARIEEDAAQVIRASLRDDRGDILVFLPGAAEIERCRRALGALPDSVEIHVLHGDLSAEAQDRAVGPAPQGRRKVVLSTAIAETSLTIDGIGVVVDCGLMRVARFDPNVGMSRLETIRVTQASAEQRRGRAGRLGPGVCYRLWAEAETRGLLPHGAPEILETDLAPLALELALWGAGDGAGLAFLDPPPRAGLAAARDLLGALGALGPDHRITPHGRRLADLGLHPRLGHMVSLATDRGLGALGADLAALLSDRDPWRGSGVDLRARLDALAGQDRGGRADAAAIDRIRRLARLWRPRGSARVPGDSAEAGSLVALAYPDRIAARRAGDGGAFRLANGRGAQVDPLDPLSREAFLAIADLDGRNLGGRVHLAAPIALPVIEEIFADRIVSEDVIRWDPREEAVIARRHRRLGALTVSDRIWSEAPAEAVAEALAEGVRALGLAVLPWTAATEQWRARVGFLRRVWPEGAWPDVSDAGLMDNLAAWLGPDLIGRARRSHLKDIDLGAALARLLPWAQMRDLDRLAPTHVEAPTGSRIALDYTQGDQPVMAVRLQEMFGQGATPRVADGRVGVLLHLLSPAGRPVQVTADLAGFWRSSYAAVRADLRGRYPKHAWPEDPATAAPLRGTKRSAAAPRRD